MHYTTVQFRLALSRVLIILCFVFREFNKLGDRRTFAVLSNGRYTNLV